MQGPAGTFSPTKRMRLQGGNSPNLSPLLSHVSRAAVSSSDELTLGIVPAFASDLVLAGMDMECTTSNRPRPHEVGPSPIRLRMNGDKVWIHPILAGTEDKEPSNTARGDGDASIAMSNFHSSIWTTVATSISATQSQSIIISVGMMGYGSAQGQTCKKTAWATVRSASEGQSGHTGHNSRPIPNGQGFTAWVVAP